MEINEGPVFSPLLRKYTIEEFWALAPPEEGGHWNLIAGYLYLVPPPPFVHGNLDSRLSRSLIAFLVANGLEGDVHHPLTPIYTLTENPTYLEPDMMYLSEELAKTMVKQRTSADIEYASKSTAIYDRTTKADTYLALGVRELWIVDSSTQTIEVRHATTKNERLLWEVVRYSENESAESRVLAGWKVSVSELFAGLAEE